MPFGEIPIKLYLQPRARDDDRDDLNKEQKKKRADYDSMSAADAGESLDGDIEDFVDEDDEFEVGEDSELEYEYNEDEKEEK